MVNLINIPFHEGSVRETAGSAGRGGRIIARIFSTLNTTQTVTRIPRRIQRTDFVSCEFELQDFPIEAVKPSEAKFVSQFRRFAVASISISKTALAGAHSRPSIFVKDNGWSCLGKPLTEGKSLLDLDARLVSGIILRYPATSGLTEIRSAPVSGKCYPRSISRQSASRSSLRKLTRTTNERRTSRASISWRLFTRL